MEKFETDIINNSRYKKYRTIRGILFIILIVYGTPAFFMGGGGSSKRKALSEDLREHPELQYYYFGLVIIGLLFGIVHYFSWRINKLGSISIDDRGIQIEENQINRLIRFSEIDNVKITRSSTYHKNDHIEKPYSGNNWIEIILKAGIIQKHEFLIKSEEHNKEFENIIQFLYSKIQYRLNYKSI